MSLIPLLFMPTAAAWALLGIPLAFWGSLTYGIYAWLSEVRCGSPYHDSLGTIRAGQTDWHWTAAEEYTEMPGIDGLSLDVVGTLFAINTTTATVSGSIGVGTCCGGVPEVYDTPPSISPTGVGTNNREVRVPTHAHAVFELPSYPNAFNPGVAGKVNTSPAELHGGWGIDYEFVIGPVCRY